MSTSPSLLMPTPQDYGENPTQEEAMDEEFDYENYKPSFTFYKQSTISDSESISTIVSYPGMRDQEFDDEETILSDQETQVDNDHETQVGTDQVPTAIPVVDPPNATNPVSKFHNPGVMSKLGELLKEISNTMEVVTGRVDDLETKVNSVINNQKYLQVRSLELDNEIQRAKIYTQNKHHGLMKDLSTREYERSNLVVFNLPINDLKCYQMKLKCDENEAIFQFGLDFINNFWTENHWPEHMKYNPLDLKVIRLTQDDVESDHREKKGPGFFRMLLKMANQGEATKLRKRCTRLGFYNIRTGLSPYERSAAAAAEAKVVELNGNLEPNSKTMFIRKFIFKVVEVERKNKKKVIKEYDWLAEEDLFETRVKPLNLVEIQPIGQHQKPTNPIASNPLNRAPAETGLPTPTALPPPTVLPQAPTSPFKPSDPSASPSLKPLPVAKPRGKQPVGNLPPTMAPIFQIGNRRKPLQTPNSRGDIVSRTTKPPVPPVINLDNSFVPSFAKYTKDGVKNGVKTGTAKKRKASSPKEKGNHKRKRPKDLSEAERIRRNQAASERRKKKILEEKEQKLATHKKVEEMEKQIASLLAMKQAYEQNTL